MSDKVTMLDMILLIESEVTRLEAWSSVQPLSVGQARALRIDRALVSMLDLLRTHEAEFLAFYDDIKARYRAVREREAANGGYEPQRSNHRKVQS